MGVSAESLDAAAVQLRALMYNQWVLGGVLAWLLLINVSTYFAYVRDKKLARLNRWRTRESTLLFLGFIGGTIGAMVAMRFARHKSSKQSFRAKFYFLTSLQVLVVGAVAVSVCYSAGLFGKRSRPVIPRTGVAATQTPAIIITTVGPRRTPPRTLSGGQAKPQPTVASHATLVHKPRREKQPTPSGKDVYILGAKGPSATSTTAETPSPFVWK